MINVQFSTYQSCPRPYWWDSEFYHWFNFRLKHRILLEKESGETVRILPMVRFTKRYRNHFLHKYWDIMHLPTYYFVTLTHGDTWSNKEEYEQCIKKWRQSWSKFYNKLRTTTKMSIKFGRSFEFTKEGRLHTHAVIFDEVDPEAMVKVAKWYDKHTGFIKIIRLISHYNYIDKFPEVNVYASKYELFLNWQGNDHIWLGKGETLSNYRLSNEVFKYILKNQSLRDKALLKKFRLRSVSVSKSLPKRNKPDATYDSYTSWDQRQYLKSLPNLPYCDPGYRKGIQYEEVIIYQTKWFDA